jgi:hypothetical protein
MREVATTWASATSRAIYGPDVTDEQIASRAQALLGGVTIQHVNTYRSLAGQYVRAQESAMSKNPADQFEAKDIFVAPWSRMAQTGGAIRQYRANVTFTSTFHGFEQVPLTETRSFLIGPTLTNANDLIAAAKSWYEQLPYNQRLSDVEISSFALEAV